MRTLRALTAILLAALAAAGGSRVSAQAVPVGPEVCARAGTELRRVQPPPESHAFLAATATASVPASVVEGSSSHLPATRTLRPMRSVPLVVPAARIAALLRERLDFAHRLDAARLGWFSFGSTAPPPFRI